VFVGTISAITPAPDNELKVDITPDEIFLGNPGSTVTATTSQGLCFDNLAVGSRWLFFLQTKGHKTIPLDFYYSSSVPAESAQGTIDTLRKLKTIGDNGILRGHVARERSSEYEYLPNIRVVARRASDHQRFNTVTDTNGSFEFPMLAAGDYKVRAELEGGKALDASVELRPRSCLSVSLLRKPAGKIEGHIRYPDGSPAAGVNLILLYGSEGGWNTRTSDDKGRFDFEYLQPGKYTLGFDLTGDAPWKNSAGSGRSQNASFYYPGVVDRSQAAPIVLKEDEQRNDIDVVLPSAPQQKPKG
jgi:hypothetical protein